VIAQSVHLLAGIISARSAKVKAEYGIITHVLRATELGTGRRKTVHLATEQVANTWGNMSTIGRLDDKMLNWNIDRGGSIDARSQSRDHLIKRKTCHASSVGISHGSFLALCWKSVSPLYTWHVYLVAETSIVVQSTVPSNTQQVMSPAKRYTSERFLRKRLLNLLRRINHPPKSLRCNSYGENAILPLPPIETKSDHNTKVKSQKS